jgi:hypothetical protein
MAAKRRSMADLLREQKAIEDATDAAPDSSPSLAVVQPARRAGAPAAFSASAVPDPHSPTGPGQLTASEEADLATCEAAVDNLRMAFAAAGKALQVIRDARLYRATHDKFEEYTEQRWDMSRAQAYRLIDAWPLAERLSPMGDKINERQIRELLPLAERHGQDAAATVYQAVAETDGTQVTAAVLRDVVGILGDDFDPDTAVQEIRAYLSGGQERSQPPSVDPAQAVTSASDQFVRRLHRLASKEPGAVRQALTEIRAALDAIEREIT